MKAPTSGVSGRARACGYPSEGDPRIRRLTLTALVAVAFGVPATADARPGCHTTKCHARVAMKRDRVELAYYHAHPMPRCTWFGESGAGLSEWHPRRYRARNPSSTAGGKFQILDTTFHAFGGPDFPGSHDAALARPVVQERIARRVLRGQGLGAWVLC